MGNDSDDKSNSTILSQDERGNSIQIGVEHIKAAYIVEGLSASDLSAKFYIPVTFIEKIIQDNQLDKLRSAHIKHGLIQLQNVQLSQAQRLMDVESQFKRIRIIQLEKSLEDYLAYYSKHGHFYKVHPITLDIMKDTNGIPVQIKIPNVSHEISQLKESVSLSEGLKQLLGQIDDIINTPKDVHNLDSGTIDVTDYNSLFQKKKSEDED